MPEPLTPTAEARAEAARAWLFARKHRYYYGEHSMEGTVRLLAEWGEVLHTAHAAALAQARAEGAAQERARLELLLMHEIEANVASSHIHGRAQTATALEYILSALRARAPEGGAPHRWPDR